MGDFSREMGTLSFMKQNILAGPHKYLKIVTDMVNFASSLGFPTLLLYFTENKHELLNPSCCGRIKFFETRKLLYNFRSW